MTKNQNASRSLVGTLGRLWDHIPNARRRQFGFLMILTVFSSFAEIISLGAVVPFIGVITQPEKILAYPFVADVANYFGIYDGSDLLIPLAVSFGVAAILAGVLRLALLWTSLNLANITGADLGIDIYTKTLCQPYTVHIRRGSSEIISGISQKVGTATSVLVSIVTVITSFLMMSGIVVTLMLVDPLLASLSALIFGVCYGLIALINRQKLQRNSQITAIEQSHVIKSLQEGLGAIRDVLLDGSQRVYVNVYAKAVTKLRRASAENSFINQSPRFVMETIGLVLISICVVALNARQDGVVGSLPILAMLALAAQRLLPLMQQLYGNWSLVVGSRAALEDVIDLLGQRMPDSAALDSVAPTVLKDSIEFVDLSFSYNQWDKPVFEKINLRVNKGARVGVVGSTGSGKSTAMDLLMGLLEPTSGHLEIDGVGLHSEASRAAWQRSVAHVPQTIFLSDASIAENIAFGVPAEEIDHDRVREAARKAQISEFIESRAEGYLESVGERGVRLSGGQRQRIGIARALYKDTSILVFDEATSALDQDTEHAIMKTIDNLSNDLTLFIIAHRLTTLKNCNQIIKFNDGKVSPVGGYKELV